MDNFRELQEGEIEVVKSIFMDDFERVSSQTAWKTVNAVQEFRITIHPAEEALKGKVRVRIHFKLPQRYPRAPPTMQLEESKGLSTVHLSALSAHLSAYALTLIGDEMIYALCTSASESIADSNSINGPSTSLGDQKIQRDAQQIKEAEKRKIEEKARKESRERQEADRLKKIIEEDVGRRRKRGEESEVDEDLFDVEEGLKVLVEGKEGKIVLGAGAVLDGLGQTVPASIRIDDARTIPVTAHIFNILSPYFLTSQAQRKLQKITFDLSNSTRASATCPALHTVIAHTLHRYSPALFPSQQKARSNDGYSLVVLSTPTPAPTQTLHSLLSSVGELRPERAIAILTPIVGAVEALHQAGVVHKSLRTRSVLVAANQVVVREAGWYQRLVDLQKSNPWCSHPDAPPEEDLSEPWTCPEALDDPFKYERARDMWDIGVLFAQMLFGLDVASKHRTPAELIKGVPRNSPIRSMLSDLLSPDAKKRPTAAKAYSQLQAPSSSISSVRAPSPTPLFSPSAASANAPVGFFYQPRQSGSRYKSEFEELEFLGKGGGGEVVKARNRLDGHLYAVKKIRLPDAKSAEEKLLREVTIWSRMNHPNIVRYHTSWVETETTTSDFDIDGSTEASTQPPSSSIITTSASDDDSSEDDDSPADFDSDSDVGDAGDLNIHMGVDPADFLSVGHSFPSVHFGNEDDPDTPPRVGGSPVIDKKGNTAEDDVRPRSVRRLYIQMEYVEKLTLKEAIEEGQDAVASWRHMHQILSAMLHFTSLNIIHRDLKPTNIFLDANNDVRIGDFGLAVNQGLADSADTSQSHSLDTSFEEADLTSGVGTSLYIAPETLSKARSDRSVKYSNKIDMYSLGIVFFELWHPFKTGMERIQVLRELRKPDIIFPPTWNKADLARETKIVQACLTHDPERRASPEDLLKSNLLPSRVGDESIQETIRLLSQSGTQHAQTLITALFNQTDVDTMRKDFSYDFYDGDGAKVDNDPYAEIVRSKLSRVFTHKGAVCMDSPLLMPQSSIYGSRKPVRMLDSDGTIVCLPFHLNIPFCRMVARDTSLTRMKRWTIAPIYRTSAAGGQPRAVLNAAFDIVTDAITAASEAECLFVADEIMGAFPFAGEVVHYINHAKILDCVVERIPSSRRSAVLDILAQHGVSRKPWSKTALDLLKIPGVTRPMVDDLSALEKPTTLAEVQMKVLAGHPNTGTRHLVKEAFEELQEILTLTQQLGIRNLKVAALLATDWDFHRDGVLFETHHIRGKNRNVVITGGRFDDVVARLAAPDVRQSGRFPHVVGFSLSVAMLSLAAAEEANSGKALLVSKNEALRSYGPWAVRRCDCYVVSFVRDLVEQRLEIVKDLWRAGIKADLMYDDDFLTLTPEQLVRACRGEGIMYLVIVKDRRIEPENTLKIKSVLRGYEEEITRADLPGWLSGRLRDHTGSDERPSGATPFESHAELMAAHQDHPATQEFFPILEDQKHKGNHKKRTMLIHRAQKNVDMSMQAASEAPIFAVDVDTAVYQVMSRSVVWITDDEAYRSLVQSALPAKRDYITQIRKSILSQRRNRQPPLNSFWLFSLRDDRSTFLMFDREDA